jgi:acyl-CoA thioester hydrolase
MSTPPEGYRYHTPMTVRYGDMDSLGHVNNAKYLTYFEQARISYIHERGLWDGTLSAVGMIVGRITVDYKQPISAKDGTIAIWTRVCRLGNKSFDMEHLLLCERDGKTEIAATGLIVMVVYDYVAHVTIPIPNEWRKLLIAFEPGLNG